MVGAPLDQVPEEMGCPIVGDGLQGRTCLTNEDLTFGGIVTMLRMAVIGVGWAGTRHAEAVKELGRKITVNCLVDSDPVHLEAKAKELGVFKTNTEIDDVLADPEVDEVSICMPHALHCEVAVAAAEAGKHVLCEKPIALTVEDATRMIRAAETAGVRLYVAENLTYAPMSRFLREQVQSGRYIGEVITASVVDGFRGVPFGYPGRRAWLARPDMGGTGTWMLHGIHRMAQMRYVLGEVEAVYMKEHHAGSFGRDDIEGTMTGLLSMENGFQVAVVQTCEIRLKKGQRRRYVIHGDRGSILATEAGCEVFSEELGKEPLHLSYPKGALSDYALEMEAFADYVTDGIEGPTTARSERRSLAIVQAGYESARDGQPVDLETRFGKL